MTGKLITFEGIDGSGKTTQLSMLKTYFQRQGIDVLAVREPGGTPVGEELRKILLNPVNSNLHYRTEALLYASARAQLVHTVIIPALNQGSLVLCDRFVDSTIAYQGYGRGLSCQFIEQINDAATGGLKPDLVFVFDIKAEESIKRIKKRRKNDCFQGDRLEGEALAFHRRVRYGYLEICKKYPDNHLLLDASLPERNLHQIVVEAAEELIDASR